MVGIMPLPDPCYLCRLLCPAKSRPSPLITVNDTICQMCLDTFPQAGNLVDTFHLPMPVAAERHGMSKHKFRSLYTKRGITKWPYRRWPYRLLRPPVASRLHFVEDLLTDLVTCLADEDLRTVPIDCGANRPSGRGPDCYTDMCEEV